MRGASCRLIDTLDQVGGQLTALYPEKYIFDVAGFPKVLAKDLVRGMAEQALQWKAPVHLGQKVVGLERGSDNGTPRFTVVTEGDAYPSRTVLVAGGSVRSRRASCRSRTRTSGTAGGCMTASSTRRSSRESAFCWWAAVTPRSTGR